MEIIQQRSITPRPPPTPRESTQQTLDQTSKNSECSPRSFDLMMKRKRARYAQVTDEQKAIQGKNRGRFAAEIYSTYLVVLFQCERKAQGKNAGKRKQAEAKHHAYMQHRASLHVVASTFEAIERQWPIMHG